MSDTSAPAQGQTSALFVRPGTGGARDLLQQMDALTDPIPTPRARAGATPGVEPGTASDTAPDAPALPKPAPAARMRKRHWGIVLSFVLFVLAPVGATGWYLWTQAEDQYGSVAAFTVRQNEGQRASDLLGGLSALTGGGSAGDSDIVYEFIQSSGMIQRVDDDLDIRSHYSAVWDTDPVFALQPDASLEELVQYWGRIVRVSHDAAAGLLEVQVRAFDPDFARQLASDIVARSQEMINNLNAQAREDALRFAQADLDEAVARLSQARGALTAFRSRAQILDPEADIQGRMGVLSNLQQQLAQALIDFDLLLQTTSANDPRLLQEQQRIDVIRARLASERLAIVDGENEGDQDYPALMSEFESLGVEREFAEQNYRLALAAVDVARDDVTRQSRYLATYITPVAAETSEYPRRGVTLGLVALFAFLSWAVGCLIFYSIRDRG